MHEHGSDELLGPVRGSAAWWRGMGAQPDSPEEGTQKAPKKRRKKRRSADPPTAQIRKDLVERVRREIAEGTYETEEKWEAALDCLLGRLQPDPDP